MSAEGPVIVIDTREQLPYRFERSVVKKLDQGDYSIEGLEHLVAVERKSKVDAYGTIGRGRERFERELERLAHLEYAAIVIECSLPDFLEPPPQSRLHPRAAVCSLLAWSVKYGVHVFFAGDRRHAQAVTFKLLEKFHKYYQAGEVAA